MGKEEAELAEQIGAEPAELKDALGAFPHLIRGIVEGARVAAQSGAVKAMVEPVVSALREMSPEDRDLFTTAVFMMSGPMSGAGLRIAAVPTDEIVRAMWGTDEACTSFDEIVADHAEEEADAKEAGEEAPEHTQLADLRQSAEAIRRLFLRELFTEGRAVDQKTAASAVHRAAEKLGLTWLPPDSKVAAARAELFQALGAFFASEKLLESPARVAAEKHLASTIAGLRTLPAKPDPIAARAAIDHVLAAWDALHADPPDPDKALAIQRRVFAMQQAVLKLRGDRTWTEQAWAFVRREVSGINVALGEAGIDPRVPLPEHFTHETSLWLLTDLGTVASKLHDVVAGVA